MNLKKESHVVQSLFKEHGFTVSVHPRSGFIDASIDGQLIYQVTERDGVVTLESKGQPLKYWLSCNPILESAFDLNYWLE
ncbi:hypothetical protein NVP1081O_307 [Vibrio phage 1.081.O._10N.286.52.C2]|nr:hypothetical protein NVP1081O_307 [Vibrio phage 1.081.O._10N.286.52.C2]